MSGFIDSPNGNDSICSFLFGISKLIRTFVKKIMKITKLFNGPFHDCLSETGKKEVDKQHTEWMKDMFSFLFVGLILGIIIGSMIG